MGELTTDRAARADAAAAGCHVLEPITEPVTEPDPSGMGYRIRRRVVAFRCDSGAEREQDAADALRRILQG